MLSGTRYKTAFAKALVIATDLLWSGAAPGQVTPPAWVELRHEIFGFGGMHVGTDRTRITSVDGHYAITADVKSVGLARVLFNVTTHSEVRGISTPDRLHPGAYRGEVRRNGENIQSRVNYWPDGTAVGESFPPAQPTRQLPAGPLSGTMDQLSVFYQTERTLARTGSCTFDATVFDGRRLYRLHFKDAGTEVLKRLGDEGFAGPTQTCRFEREAIAGFSKENDRSEGIFEGRIWYARLLGGEIVVPVRMVFGTEFGSLTGELAELHAPGLDWRFRE